MIIEEGTRIYFGMIKGSTFVDGALAYSVLIEDYHNAETPPTNYATGIPVFSIKENSVRFKEDTRVFILIKNGDYTNVYIMGEIFDRAKFDGTDPDLKEGDINFSDRDSKSGLEGMGSASSQIRMFFEDTSLVLSSASTTIIKKGINLLDVSENRGYIGNNHSFLSLGQESVLLSKGKITMFSENGEINLDAPSIELKANANLMSLKSVKQMEISSPLMIMKTGAFKFQGTLGSAFGPEATVDFNILKGDYKIGIGAGDLDVTIFDPATSKISLVLGYPVSSASFVMSISEIILKNKVANLNMSSLGAIALKNDAASVSLSVTGEISAKGPVGSILISPTGTITIKNSRVTIECTTAGKVTIDAPDGVKIDGDVEVDGDIEIDGDVEVTGKVTADQDVIGGPTKVSLSKHGHTTIFGPTIPPVLPELG